MFEVFQMVLRDPEVQWALFTRISAARKIDREFIDMLGYLVEAQLPFNSVPLFLHCKFDHWVHVTKTTTDIDFAKNVQVEEIFKDGKHSKEDILRYIEDFFGN